MCIIQIVLILSSVLALSSVQAIVKYADFGSKLQEFVVPLREKCISKTGINQALIERVIDGEFIELVGEPIIKEYMVCLLVEGKLIDEQLEVNLELLPTLIPENIKNDTLKNVKSCYATHKGVTDLTEKVFKVFKCYYEKNPDIFLFY